MRQDEICEKSRPNMTLVLSTWKNTSIVNVHIGNIWKLVITGFLFHHILVIPSAVQIFFFWNNADASILGEYSGLIVHGLFEAIIVENITGSEFHLR